jgi:hypothetical protein
MRGREEVFITNGSKSVKENKEKEIKTGEQGRRQEDVVSQFGFQ